jgi:predicted dehydrogenase
VAVIGCGQWGANHVRVFDALPGAAVKWVVDESAERRRHIASRYAHLRVTGDCAGPLADPEVDAVVVATPASTHAAIALAALGAGKHVLCEKPLGRSAAECRDLVAAAATAGRVLMVGHVFLFNPGILRLKDLVDAGELGRLSYASAVRANPGPIRSDVNVAWDLAAHEVAIFDFLLGASAVSVSASGRSFIRPGVEDIAFITLSYPNDVAVGVTTSWLHPRKVREISLVGDRKMVTFDDLAASPVAIHSGGAGPARAYYDTYGEFHLLAGEAETSIPAIPPAEPLVEQARFFLTALDKGHAGVVAGERGLAVVLTLEAISRSIQLGGAPVEVASGGDPRP